MWNEEDTNNDQLAQDGTLREKRRLDRGFPEFCKTILHAFFDENDIAQEETRDCGEELIERVFAVAVAILSSEVCGITQT